jgi:hypothetical protein
MSLNCTLIATASVALSLFCLVKNSSCQDVAGIEDPPPAASYDSELIVSSVKAIGKKADFDFRNMSIRAALDQISVRHGLTFDTSRIDDITTKPADLESNGTLGDTLLGLLRPIRCDFAIRSDGRIVLSKVADPVTAKPIPFERIPTLRELEEFVGTKFESADFQEFVDKFGFHKNHKRERSWGSNFGVFIEVSPGSTAIVTIRPLGSKFGANYAGELPYELKAGDSLKTLLKKLGRPSRTTGRKNAFYTMHFKDVKVATSDGKLFEIYLSTTTEAHEETRPKRSKKSE